MGLTVQKEAVIMFRVMVEKNEVIGVEILRRRRRIISRVLVEMAPKASRTDQPFSCIS